MVFLSRDFLLIIAGMDTLCNWDGAFRINASKQAA